MFIFATRARNAVVARRDVPIPTRARACPVTSATHATRSHVVVAIVAFVLGDTFLIRARAEALPETTHRPSRAPRSDTQRAAAGPWGNLELTRIELEPPRSVTSRLIAPEATRWSFSSTDHAGVLEALRAATLTPEQIERCDTQGHWTSIGTTTVVEPPLDVVFALLPEARTRLYRTLAASAENLNHRNPMSVSPIAVGAVEAAGLTPETVHRFHSLLYGPGPWRLLSDMPALLTACPSPAERIRFVTAVLRHESYVVRLLINHRTNVDALLSYWSARGRDESARALLESIARLSGETGVDVRGLLPAWQSGRINRYPRPSDPIEPLVDCFWTALNFFADQPGPAPNGAAVFAALKTRYRPVTEPTFGDLVVLMNKAGVPVHAAIYIADDLALTKNGAGTLRPWAYMKLPDLVAFYSSSHGRLRLVYVTETRVFAAPR